MSTYGRNYVKFDFNNIKLADTWDLRIQHLKNLLVEYIKKNKHSIFSKQYLENVLNYYAVTSKLTVLNEIYILLIFVYPHDDFEKYNDILLDISKYINENTKFSKISLWYQLTKSKMKPSENEKISYISGPIDICENVLDYRIYISPNSFTQSNYDAMIQLYRLIFKITSENKTDVLHYYGRGMTPISHVLKDNFKHIYGYSSCPISYNDGLKSVKENSVTNIELIYDKNKEIFFDNLDKDDNRTIIISASRNGFRKLDKIKTFSKFIYISCNMKSFLDEIKGLNIKYEILGEVDMFPGTEHKETILSLINI
jgi:tRNA/tmRNA/rRNA uracil-C5-methylase (TrmA/RlmC/RlmD family)